jgi:hypothetical protein
MAKRQKRRINLAAQIAGIAVFLLILFEGLVIGGIFELQAPAVAKFAPWAFEPFLRIVGEHPESAPRVAMVEEINPTESASKTALGLTGFSPESIPILTENSEILSNTNNSIELSQPSEIAPEHTPAVLETNSIDAEVETAKPVG